MFCFCVNVYCHRVSTQLQLTNISIKNILLLLPLALQPTVDFGLSNKILPCFPICHQLSPSSLNPSSFFLCSTFVTVSFYCVRLLAPRQSPTWRTRASFSSGSSPLTCLAWDALPVAHATASIALGIMWPHKPHHYVKVGIPSGGINNIPPSISWSLGWSLLFRSSH
jgi:hypothetical protein